MLPVPTTVDTLLILGFGIAFTLMDARASFVPGAPRAERKLLTCAMQTLASSIARPACRTAPASRS